jgi:catechol 2,3-dioxygenase-like lactoylglutathione lyase family enzyme
MSVSMKKLMILVVAALAAVLLLAQDTHPRPRITGMPHVDFRVHDMAASRHFYLDFLGYQEPFDINGPDGKLVMAFIKINDRQYIELSPEAKADEPRFVHLALETDDAEALRLYVKSKGYKASDKPVSKGRIRNLGGAGLEDPDGNKIDVTQYLPESESLQDVGKHMSDARISTHLLHVGFYVSKPETAKYYIDLLGFREFWRGTADGKVASYSNLLVPEGIDYVEFLFAKPTAATMGTTYHVALEVPDMDKAIAKLNANPARQDYKRSIEVKTGRNHRRQCNLFDPDGTRVELMEDHTVDGMPSPLSRLAMFGK